jgi:hypothetical protein
VRIEHPGVQPLHCLIVEGPEGLRIRSWVANTTLNGVPFSIEATIAFYAREGWSDYGRWFVKPLAEGVGPGGQPTDDN